MIIRLLLINGITQKQKQKIIPVFFNLGHSHFIVISKSARLVRTARTRNALPLFSFENMKYLLKCEQNFGIIWLF